MRSTHVLLATLFALLAACSGGSENGGAQPPGASAYQPPATEPGEDGWMVYLDAPNLTPGNSADVFPGTASPEAALTHFYASRMRGDERWKEVLIPDPGKRLKRKLEEYDTWKILEMRLVRRKASGDDPDRLYIKIDMKIEYEGGVDGGIDDATLRKVDGKWYVESIPT